MLKNVIIILLAWFGGRYILDLDFAGYYTLVTGYIASKTVMLLTSGTAGSLVFVAVAFFLGETGFFTLMKVLGKTLFELSQSAIHFICLAAVIFYFQLDVNLWLDLGLAAMLPFATFLASCLALRIFDFNYPIWERLLENVGAAFLSALIVFTCWFVFA